MVHCRNDLFFESWLLFSYSWGLIIDFSGVKYVQIFTLNKISHKCFTLAFTVKSEYTLGSAQRIAHSGPHAETRGSTLAVAWSV